VRLNLNNSSKTIFIDTIYKPSIGSFGKPSGLNNDRYMVKNWQYCREIWHSQMYNTKIFFYAYPASKIKTISLFFEIIEKKINTPQFSSFGPTQKKHIMYIKPSPWWLRYGMRRSLFTILLRSSSAYDPSNKNFNVALYSNLYAEKTKSAIEHFLAGNTVYKGRKRGWYKQFLESQVDQDLIKVLLVPEY